MKLYLVMASGYDYDEWDAFVVRAKDEDDAFRVVTVPDGEHNYSNFKRDTCTIAEIKQKGASEIILGSFNAG